MVCFKVLSCIVGNTCLRGVLMPSLCFASFYASSSVFSFLQKPWNIEVLGELLLLSRK